MGLIVLVHKEGEWPYHRHSISSFVQLPYVNPARRRLFKMHWISQCKTIKSNHANFINTKAWADNIWSTPMITLANACVHLRFILKDTWDGSICKDLLNAAFKHRSLRSVLSEE